MKDLKDYYLEIFRKKASYDFIVDKNYRYVGNGNDKAFTFDDYHNNVKNNMLDSCRLKHKDDVIYECNQLQTVANYPLAHVRDTMSPGVFGLLLFVKQGHYKNPIHGFVHVLDMEGQLVNINSMQWDDNHLKGRWLFHDKYYYSKEHWINPKYAYSKACCICDEKDQLFFNATLRKIGVNKDGEFILNGLLKEIN